MNRINKNTVLKFDKILKEASQLIVDLNKGDYLDIKITFCKKRVFSLTIIGSNFKYFRFALKRDFKHLTKYIYNYMFFENFKWLKIAVLNFIKNYEY